MKSELGWGSVEGGSAGESSRETHPWAPFLKKALGVLHIGFWV